MIPPPVTKIHGTPNADTLQSLPGGDPLGDQGHIEKAEFAEAVDISDRRGQFVATGQVPSSLVGHSGQDRSLPASIARLAGT